MKKYFWRIILLLTIALGIPTTKVSADSGPKPSVVVTFEGVEGETYFATLLSKTDSTGPWDVKNECPDYCESKEVWQKFKAYSDVDGYYFLGQLSECSTTNEYTWGYYPPDDFKILLYFPKKDQYVVSEKSYGKYAFDSYYTVRLTETYLSTGKIPADETSITRSYSFNHEILAFICRILLTLLIELGIAWLFGYWNKKAIAVITITNVVTQGILNVVLNLITYQRGADAIKIHYFWLECVVFLIEGLVYQFLILRDNHEVAARKNIWLYALVANVSSFVLGVLLSMVFPGIF